jgi:hypothetical protein
MNCQNKPGWLDYVHGESGRNLMPVPAGSRLHNPGGFIRQSFAGRSAVPVISTSERQAGRLDIV